MGDRLQELPISVQSFEKLRNNDFLYIDKTKDILNLVKNEGSYFLSRPRRFGKSLLINTLESLFLGKKELFKDLYVYDKWDWNESYPVIRIDFSEMDHSSLNEFEESLNEYLDEIASNFGVILKSKSIIGKFRNLIKEIAKITNKKVVVLVDEYDSPILDHISKIDVAEDNKELLSGFYKVLKSQDDSLKFVFLTGVSKFVGTSIFSGLNSPDDISLDEKFSTICGYTQEELESYFKPYFENLSKKYNYTYNETLDKIKEEYDGYSWDGKTYLYNPQSTLLLFRKNVFTNYWFRTGTPTFLLDLIKEKNEVDSLKEEIIVSDHDLTDSYEVDEIDIVPLLFQTGYLTIKSFLLKDNSIEYTLKIPNNEVKESLYKHVIKNYTSYSFRKINSLLKTTHDQLVNSDNEGLESSIREMLAPISYLIHDKGWRYYQSLFTLWLNLQGFDIISEEHTNIGRIDATIRLKDKIIITEIKYSENENKLDYNLKEALKQIKNRKYHEKYIGKYDITLLGISFGDMQVKCEFKKIND